MSSNKGLALGFEFLDIEIIDHKKEPELSNEKWNCDQCSLFFLNKEKLLEHKNKHLAALQILKCQYCNKTLSLQNESKECYDNRKCNTCEYKCSNCPLRFQRHSSLMNHEKTHLHSKKKRPALKRKSLVTGTELETVTNNNITNKRSTQKIVSDHSTDIERKRNEDVTVSLSPKKRRRTLPDIIKKRKSLPHNGSDIIKTPKQSLTNLNKISEDKIIKDNKETNLSMSADSTNSSLHDSVVNYKPFSCHVCGENFASGDSLLQHIKSHGENVLKGFKCKHCGDEFDDIYKMQYHLAICPLAEDETTLVKNIPPRFHKIPSIGSLHKKGRPRKIKQESSDETLNYDLTPSLSTRGSVKKRVQTNEPSDLDNETPNTFSNLSLKHSRPRRDKTYKSRINKFNLENEFVDSNFDEMENYRDDHIKEDPLGGVDIEIENVDNSLNESFETVEDVGKVHSCPFPRCGIKFSREKALLCHMRNHTDDFEDSYKCHKCDIPFDDIQSLRTHLNECKDIKEENLDNSSEPDYADEYNATDKSCHTFQRKKSDFTCNVCGKTFTSQEKLKRCLHNTITRHSEEVLPCRLCEQKYNNEELLKKHFRSTHSMDLPFQCSLCYVEFDSKTAEAEHSLTHLDHDDFECIICFLKLPTYKDLYFHYKQDHVIKLQSICKICNKMFPNERLLLKHNNFCHEKEDRNKCIFCHKSFSSSAGLGVHIKRHTNKKIMKCTICYRAFLDSGDLMKHMLFHASIIANERPFKCCLCLGSFKHEVLLDTHVRRTHLRKTILDFKCPICEEKLNDAKIIASHLIDHSIRISKNTSTKLEIKWLKKRRSESSGNETPFKRGRPKKFTNAIKSVPTKKSNKMNTESSDSEDQGEQKCSTEVSSNCNESLTYNYCDSSITTKQKRGLYDSERITQLPVNTDGPILKYNTRNKIIYKDIDLDDSSDTPVVSSGQSRGKQREISQTECSQDKKVTSKRMSFIKISTSCNQGRITPQIQQRTTRPVTSSSNGNQGRITPQIQQRTTRPVASSCNGIEEWTEKAEMPNNCHNSSNYIIPDILEEAFGHIDDTSRNENDPCDMVKEEKEDIFFSTKSMDHIIPKVKDEESDYFIREKKYFEPSLGLTKYSCTTCVLSFSSQDELLYHNTQHIL